MKKFSFTRKELEKLLKTVSNLQRHEDYQIAGNYLIREDSVAENYLEIIDAMSYNELMLLDILSLGEADILTKFTLEEILEINDESVS